MHFAVVSQHLDFFYRHHYIEFEDLLNETEVKTLSESLLETLGNRLHSTPEKFAKTDAKTLYLSGHDLWRDNKTVQKFVLRPQFAEIAASLTKKRPLRIAFDQFFSASDLSDPLFKKPLPLHQMSCIRGLVCGCILLLSPSITPASQETLVIEEDLTALIPIPKKAGSAIFFSPDIPLSFDYLSNTPDMLQLLIVYGEEKSLYTYQETDLHTHGLKKFGYVFGDRLKNTTHPTLFRG